MNLAPERELIIIASRVEIEPRLKERFTYLLSKRLDWGEIIHLAALHKVFTLLWYHLRNLDLTNIMEAQVSRLFETCYTAHQERNRYYLNEFVRILKAADEQGIRIAPLKGALFFGTIYPELGMRTINDIDILVPEEDKLEITQLLTSLGYAQQEYDPVSEELMPISRKERLFWNLYISNLFPFRRKAESPLVATYNIDVHLSITWKGKEQYFVDTEELFERSNPIFYEGVKCFPLSFEDNLIHLCSHLYRHAVLFDTIRDLDDLALIKFCDIREYIRERGSKIEWDELTNMVKSYGIERPVYYALYYVYMLYNDTVPQRFLKAIRPENLEYLDQYGMLDTKKVFKWKLPFIERLFNTKRLDEFKNHEIRTL